MERLKVFISSTQKDLQQERNSAEEIIAKLGHDCLRAETFDSPGFSSEDACRIMSSNCDIYIGIYGERYGSIVPKLGISATEMEYKEARSHNPGKVFVYIKKVDNIDLEQKKFLEEVQNFSNGYFRHEKFRDPNQLAEQIHRDLITWTTQKVRQALWKEIEAKALRDKVAHLSRVMTLYGIPEDLR